MSPTDFGFAKLISMHDESFFANFAVFNVQPRFTVVLPPNMHFYFLPIFTCYCAYLVRFSCGQRVAIMHTCQGTHNVSLILGRCPPQV